MILDAGMLQERTGSEGRGPKLGWTEKPPDVSGPAWRPAAPGIGGVRRFESVAMMKMHGHVIWLFGLPGSGKSTLAAALRSALLPKTSARILMLDGDRLRSGLSRGLGFTDPDREENLRRAGEVALLGVESGLIVIAAFITPRERHRELIRGIVGESRLSLVHLAATLDVCRKRDPKGLYAGSDAGVVRRLSGIDSTFDEAQRVDLRLDTGVRDVHECIATLVEFLGPRLPSDP